MLWDGAWQVATLLEREREGGLYKVHLDEYDEYPLKCTEACLRPPSGLMPAVPAALAGGSPKRKQRSKPTTAELESADNSEDADDVEDAEAAAPFKHKQARAVPPPGWIRETRQAKRRNYDVFRSPDGNTIQPSAKKAWAHANAQAAAVSRAAAEEEEEEEFEPAEAAQAEMQVEAEDVEEVDAMEDGQQVEATAAATDKSEAELEADGEEEEEEAGDWQEDWIGEDNHDDEEVDPGAPDLHNSLQDSDDNGSGPFKVELTQLNVEFYKLADAPTADVEQAKALLERHFCSSGLDHEARKHHKQLIACLLMRKINESHELQNFNKRGGNGGTMVLRNSEEIDNLHLGIARYNDEVVGATCCSLVRENRRQKTQVRSQASQLHPFALQGSHASCVLRALSTALLKLCSLRLATPSTRSSDRGLAARCCPSWKSGLSSSRGSAPL